MTDLITERLILKPVTLDYVQDIFNSFTEKVTVYMYPCPSKSIDETTSVVNSFIKQRENKTDYVYAITLAENGEFIGLSGLHNLKSDNPELGIWTKLDSHGNHYGREAIGALIKLADEMGYKKVNYPVDRRNTASKKIPLYYNGALTTELIELKTPDGRIIEEVIYEITLN